MDHRVKVRGQKLMHAQTFTHLISVRINDVRIQMVLVHAYSVWEGNWFCTNRPIQLFLIKVTFMECQKYI